MGGMSERLRPADVVSLFRETASTPQHVGWLAIFEVPATGFDYNRLLRLLHERISLAPRYRQKLRTVPGNLANPVWVDDSRFDITYHVRRSALPRPGTSAQLLEFAARIQARRLDRSRPLWEMYLIEGLSDGSIAILTKAHQALVDGSAALDISEVLLDAAPQPRRAVRRHWSPEPEPSSAALLLGAVRDVIRRPAALAQSAVLAAQDVRAAPERLGGLLGGALGAVLSVSARTAATLRKQAVSPLQARPGPRRRLAVVRTTLADHRRVRDQLGGTVNDVVLATVTSGLRTWLLARGEPLEPASIVRALVPVSVRTPADRGVAAMLVDLPVGQPEPVRRLAQLRYAMSAHTASGYSVGADVLASLGGFTPPTLHALGARASSELTQRLYNLAITNVPGPQAPHYAAGARMTEMFPFQPLRRGHAISIALTSYDGGVYYGITADHDAVPDVELFAGGHRAGPGRAVPRGGDGVGFGRQAASPDREGRRRGADMTRGTATRARAWRRGRAGFCMDARRAGRAGVGARPGRPRAGPGGRHLGGLGRRWHAGLRALGRRDVPAPPGRAAARRPGDRL